MKTKLLAIAFICVTLSACGPLSTLTSLLNTKTSDGLHVSAQVGDQNAKIGGKHLATKTNHGTINASDNQITSAKTVNIYSWASEHVWILALIMFIFGFIIGWPMAKTPQHYISRWFK